MTYYRWDGFGENIITEYDDPNTDWVIENQSQTYMPGLAEIYGNDASTGAYRYYSPDLLGSVMRLRDQNKASLASYRYDPYGNPYYQSGLPLNYGYTGHKWDPEVGMNYAFYRYYSPANARWIARDPLG
jgi:hypothetical protein